MLRPTLSNRVDKPYPWGVVSLVVTLISTNKKGSDGLMPRVAEKLTVPVGFIFDNITEGRFAVTDDRYGDKATFFAIDLMKPRQRMSWHTRAVLGALRIRQVRHAEQSPVVKAYIMPKTGDVIDMGWGATKVQDLVLRTLTSPWDHARQYATFMGRCARCGAGLIDDRSRWYGIGPECEKNWPEYMNLVNDEQGVFQP